MLFVGCNRPCLVPDAVTPFGLQGRPAVPSKVATTMVVIVWFWHEKPAAPLVGDVFIMPVVGSARDAVVSSKARAWSGCVGRIRTYEIGSLVLVVDRSAVSRSMPGPVTGRSFMLI